MTRDNARAHERPQIRSTTILAVRRNNHVAVAGDGQVTFDKKVMKAHANDTLRTKQLMLATDGSFLPVGFESDVKNPVNFNLGLTWQGSNGVFAGLGWTYRFTVDKRDEYLGQYTNGAGDRRNITRPPSAPPIIAPRNNESIFPQPNHWPTW